MLKMLNQNLNIFGYIKTVETVETVVTVSFSKINLLSE